MKKFAKVLMLIFLIACICITFVACGNKSGSGKQIPLYTGMSVVTGSRLANASYSAPSNADAFSQIPEEVEEDNEFSQSVEEAVLPSISVNTTNEIEYYAEKTTDIFINVHLNNPEGFVILRFTLNGMTYQNYQFEPGSTSELLILKVNTGDVCGVKDYTIDAIKYIDDADNLTKDVDMTGGDKVVKVGVTYDSAPAVNVGKINTTTEKISFSATFTDSYSLVKAGQIKAYLYDGSEIIETAALEKGNNNVEFNNVVENKTYQYAIVAVYDILDGNGEQKVVLDEGEVKTLPYYYIQSVKPDKESITFSIGQNPGTRNVRFNVIALQNAMGKTVAMLEEATDTKFEDTLSDTDYTVALYYYYEKDGKTVNCVAKMPTRTLAKSVPSINLTTSNVTTTGFDFAVAVTDTDEVGEITGIKLNDEKKEDLTVRSFADLWSNKDYTVKVIYTYDLNDGNNANEIVKTVTVHTTAKVAPTVTLSTSNITQTSFDFALESIDPDNILDSVSITLNGETFDKTEAELKDLKPNYDYKFEIVYTYDLNEGEGKLQKDRTWTINTLCDPENMDVWDINADRSYNGNTDIKTVVFHNGVTKIYGNTFHCVNLNKITLPATLEEVEEGAFDNNNSFVSIYYEGTLEQWFDITFRGRMFYGCDIYIGGERIDDLVVPDAVTEIGRYQFAGWRGRSIAFSNVNTIREFAFDGCFESLRTIFIPKTVTKVEQNAFTFADPESIDPYAYYAIYAEAESKPQDWEMNAVWNSKGIYTDEQGIKYLLYNNNTAEVIGYIRTSDEPHRIDVKLDGYTVTKICKVVFETANLSTVYLYEGLIDIEFRAFGGISSLITVVIPKSLSYIGDVFYGCENLTNIYYLGTMSEWEALDVYYLPDSASIYYYSYINPYDSNPDDSAKYWHYVDDDVDVWTKSNQE